MNKEKQEECLHLSDEIIKNIELSEIPMSAVILKCLRLCRLLGDEFGIKLFGYEVSGYASDDENKLLPDSVEKANFVGRQNKQNAGYYFTASLANIEEMIEANKIRLSSAIDPNISVSSSNPNQYVFAPIGNGIERKSISENISSNTRLLNNVKGHIYKYMLNINYALKYGSVIEGIFSEDIARVNKKLSNICPEAIRIFNSVYENIDSANSEDWANAVHSCRRILKEVADSLYPPSDVPVVGKNKTVNVSEGNYINRLVLYIEDHSASKTYASVVGTTLSSIGKRLDAINDAACKGTHEKVTQEEAKRYIIYTYMTLADIVSLIPEE